IIDKPAGLTSHDVVARVRRILRERRVGHTGTLDPFATGVLVILVGRATRLAQFLSGAEKEYHAVVRFGYSTDTGDLTGKPISNTSPVTMRSSPLTWSDHEIEEALHSLRGDIDQVPPMYSAKKLEGRKLYELARRGETVARNSVRVNVREFEALRCAGQLLTNNGDSTVDLAARVVCSAGTYVRTLAEALGERLGVGAHLAELHRTRAGDFLIESAVTLDQLKDKVDEETLETVLLPPDQALQNMPFVDLTERDAQRVRQGIAISLSQHSDGAAAQGDNVRMRDEAGRLVAVGCYDAATKSLQPRVVISLEP
ncbi:MAG: tRNA pseudouridine(55) synthase TruB, partial [Pyrinomonadaceae bacterium]|nr:tRNA pseudouridine(55) synthase TruB [Pyrinomonadaceae bacterium]